MKNVNVAFVNSNEDYRNLYLTDEKGLENLEGEPQYVRKLIQLNDYYNVILWNDCGITFQHYPEHTFEYFMVTHIWGEAQFLEKFGIEDDMLEQHIKDNKKAYYDEIKLFCDLTEPDGDSISGVVVIKNNEIVMGTLAKVI